MTNRIGSMGNPTIRYSVALIALVLLASQSACTSLSHSSYRQVIRIEGPNPGDSVYINGERQGEAPGFFEVRRGFAPQVEIESKTGKRQVAVQTKYRWSRSFWSGWVFFGYAPVAWLTDIATGTAWDLEDVNLSSSPGLNVGNGKIAIAPPRAESAEISDNAGSLLYDKLKEKYSADHVLNYRDTLLAFLENEYVYDIHTADRGQSRRLYREVGADRIFESTVLEEDGQLVVASNELNIVTGEKKSGPKVKLSEAEVTRKLPGTSFKLGNSWWSRLVPNTLGVDIVDERLQIELATTGLVYELRPVHTEEWWATGLRYISSLNISSTPDRRREFGSKWIFSAVPALRLSRRDVKAVDLPIPPGSFVERDPEFTRWIISGGYGLQIGYLSGRHYTFLDMIPTFSWNQVSWRQGGSYQSATRTAMGAQSEFGYTYIWGNSWLLKFFSRSQLEVTEVWKDALSSRLGSAQYPVSASTVLSGLTIAYQFDAYQRKF